MAFSLKYSHHKVMPFLCLHPMPSLLSRMGVYLLEEQKTTIPQIGMISDSFVQLSAPEKPSKISLFVLGYTQSGCWDITPKLFPRIMYMFFRHMTVISPIPFPLKSNPHHPNFDLTLALGVLILCYPLSITIMKAPFCGNARWMWGLLHVSTFFQES